MWRSLPKSEAWMAQISVLTASHAQTSLQSDTLNAYRPTDRPTKTYFPDTARQLALPVTYREREKMSVPNCFPSGGYISHTSDILLAFHQQKMLIYSIREKFLHELSSEEQGRGSHLCHRDCSVLGMRKFAPTFPLPIKRRGFKGQELSSTQPSHH